MRGLRDLSLENPRVHLSLVERIMVDRGSKHFGGQSWVFASLRILLKRKQHPPVGGPLAALVERLRCLGADLVIFDDISSFHLAGSPIQEVQLRLQRAWACVTGHQASLCVNPLLACNQWIGAKVVMHGAGGQMPNRPSCGGP